MESNKNKKFNEYELQILNCFKQMTISFPQISNETLICETATRLNIFDKKNIHYHKAFLNLYNKGYLEKDNIISI